jgi:VanZ family protein
MPKVTFLKFLRLLSLWLFWPGVALIVWGELTPAPPHLEGLFGWDKLDHFVAYFGLAAMATMVVGIRPRLLAILAAITAFSGLLELIQFIAGRDAELSDFIANSLGVACGFSAALLIHFLLQDRALVARRAAR